MDEGRDFGTTHENREKIRDDRQVYELDLNPVGVREVSRATRGISSRHRVVLVKAPVDGQVLAAILNDGG